MNKMSFGNLNLWNCLLVVEVESESYLVTYFYK